MSPPVGPPGWIQPRRSGMAERADGASLLQAEEVWKTYGEGVVTTALRGVDLPVEPGQLCALTGPPGCGKSTPLNILELLDRPTSGRVLIHGVDKGPLSDDERTRLRAETLGFVSQFHHLLPAFTALENVMMPLLAHHGRARRWMREWAADLLVQVDLADESTGNLDTEAGDRVMDTLLAIRQKRGTTFLIVTHDHEIARRCHRVIHMVDGRIQSDAGASPDS